MEQKRRSMNRKLSQEKLLAEFEEQRERHLHNHKQKAEHQQLRASAKKDDNYHLTKSVSAKAFTKNHSNDTRLFENK